MRAGTPKFRIGQPLGRHCRIGTGLQSAPTSRSHGSLSTSHTDRSGIRRQMQTVWPLMRLEHQIKELKRRSLAPRRVRARNIQANPRGYCGSICVIAMTRAHFRGLLLDKLRQRARWRKKRFDGEHRAAFLSGLIHIPLTAVEMRLTIVAGIRAPTDRTSHLDRNRPGVTLLCCSMRLKYCCTNSTQFSSCCSMARWTAAMVVSSIWNLALCAAAYGAHANNAILAAIHTQRGFLLMISSSSGNRYCLHHVILMRRLHLSYSYAARLGRSRAVRIGLT